MALFRRFVVAVSQNGLAVSGIRCEIKKRRLFTLACAESRKVDAEGRRAFVEVCSGIRPDPEDYVISELPAEEVVFRRMSIPKVIFESIAKRRAGALKIHIASEMGIDPSSFVVQPLSVVPSGDVNTVVVALAKTSVVNDHVSLLTSSGFPEPDVVEVAPIKWLHAVDWSSASPSCFVTVLDLDYTAFFLFHGARLLNVYISLEDNLMNALGLLADSLGEDEWDVLEKLRSNEIDSSMVMDVFTSLFPYNLAKHVSYLVGSTSELPSGRVSDFVPVNYVISPCQRCTEILVEAFKTAGSFPFRDVEIDEAPTISRDTGRDLRDLGAFLLALRGGKDLVKGELVPA